MNKTITISAPLRQQFDAVGSAVRSTSPTLYWIVLLHLAVALLCVPAMMIDDRTLLGVSVWLKPFKFLISDAIYIFTVGYFIGLYPYSQKDRVTFGVVDGNRYIIDETMYTSLDPHKFFRINRGQIVAKTSVIKIEPYFNHRVKLTIANPRDQEFVVSRPKTTEFKVWMNS